MSTYRASVKVTFRFQFLTSGLIDQQKLVLEKRADADKAQGAGGAAHHK